MACVGRVKHDVPHCTSSKGTQVFFDDATGKYSAYCFSCAARGLEAYTPDPYATGSTPIDPPKSKTIEEIQKEINEIRALKPPDFKHREIPVEYFSRAGVKMAFSEYDGKTPNSFNFPYSSKGKLIGYKTILLAKKLMWSVGNIKDADLYNWEHAKKKGTKRLYITEGEWDCHALEYMLEKQSGNKYKYAVVSLPHGAGSAGNVLGRMRKEIEEIFDEIVLVFDADEAGEKAIKDVQKVIPTVLEAPHVAGIKDANDALQKGVEKTFVDFVMWKARKPPMEGVVTVSVAMDRGTKAPEMGLSYPFQRLTEVTYGQKFGEATCIAGAVSSGKCQGYGTPILMYNGSFKPAQDVVVGDILMGDDSTPRIVKSTVKGRDEMFKVVPVKGDAYTFNRDHILAVKMTNLGKDRKHIVDADGVRHYSGQKSIITIDTYLRSSNHLKAGLKLYKTGVEFNNNSELPIPPYILGIWLGDGTTDSPSITTKDEVIKNEWISWGESIGCDVRISQGNNCETIFLKTALGKVNPALDLFRHIGVMGDKHIPDIYKTASRKDRLELLAGILDTDGHVKRGGFDLVLKLKKLSEDIVFVSRSLGFAANLKVCTKGIKSTGFVGTYYRQTISGSVEEIPNRLKKSSRSKNRDVLVTGFKIESVGVDDYYGFDISGNRLYVLGDFTVTHNTLTAHEIMAWNMIQHKTPCFAVLLEEQNLKTLWNCAAKIDSIPYNKPEVYEKNIERFHETIKRLEDKLYLWNSQGSTEYRFDIEEIISAIRFNNLEYGCRSFFIDNMTKLTDHLTTTETNEFINRYSSEISNLAEELNVNIVLYSHLNPPKGKDVISHEQGAEIYPSQLTGSRGIMRSFSTILGFERNQYAEDGKDSNSFISILKNRDYGTKEKIKTQYSPSTGRLVEFDWQGDSLY